MVNLDSCIERCYKGELLTESEVEEVCNRLKEQLMCVPNVRRLQAPVTVVGDIHGQFSDLLELFRVSGICPDTNYLFLGDYVDRGRDSVQVISLLACLCVRHPHRITLLRGNHETRQITQVYGFYSECLRKFGTTRVWTAFTDLFDFLCVSAVIDDTVFCVHAGLSPSVLSVEQIVILDRFHEVPSDGALADLVWSDPDAVRNGFNQSNRGAGYTFGADIAERFLHTNNLNHILRAHQLCMQGFQIMFDNQLSTVWSAPNYCYRCGNLASTLEIDEQLEFFFNVFGPSPDEDSDQPEGKGGGFARPDYFL